MDRVTKKDTGEIQFVDETTSPDPQGLDDRCCENVLQDRFRDYTTVTPDVNVFHVHHRHRVVSRTPRHPVPQSPPSSPTGTYV